MAASPTRSSVLEARRILVQGRVQGVGFRPFVFRLAKQLGLCGWVCNTGGEVEILVQGDPSSLQRFERGLVDKAPPLARPQVVGSKPDALTNADDFLIRKSHNDATPHIHVPPDQFACDDCIGEMQDPAARRYRYPFINCTQCGPRYTIIRGMPYDRPNTTMDVFPLCPACKAEYDNPLDRRFHAQPLACPECGPHLSYISDGTAIDNGKTAMEAAIAALQRGWILGLRGIGGYHLICDAGDDETVRRLRLRKLRPDKPLAIMLPLAGSDGLDWVRAVSTPNTEQLALLQDPMRPIVLLPLRQDAPIAPAIAPGLTEVGVMLPYSPLHHLLLEAYGRPLVATSGNISGEPVLTDIAEAERRLGDIADAFMHHNRPIQRPADDPVYRHIGGRMRPIRLGRGNAPMEVKLPFTLPKAVLATGAFMKTTVALAWADRLIVSPHIGDLSSPRSRKVFGQVAQDLQALYKVQAEVVACDAHPDFPNSRWARQSGLEVMEVFHHHAHAAVVANYNAEPVLCFTWDGVGLGPDGSLWGGEALLGQAGNWRRVASFRPFRLPGGERVALEPWRTAVSLCWHVDLTSDITVLDPKGFLYAAWANGINAPWTTAVGRLFDAGAVLAGLPVCASYDGQLPMMLEAVADKNASHPSLPISLHDDIWQADWLPLIEMLLQPELPATQKAGQFHDALANTLHAQAERVRADCGVNRVGLCGGVFQNRLLTEKVRELLAAAKFEVIMPEQIPVNDAGLSYGQIQEVAARMEAA